MTRFSVLLIVFVLLALPSLALAQDVEPVVQPAPIETGINVLEWLILLLGVWVAISAPVTIAFGHLKEQVLNRILAYVGTVEELKPLRTLVIIFGVLVASFIVVQEGDLNIFTEAPETLQGWNSDLQTLLTWLFVASGAFIWHGVGDVFSSLKVIEFVTDARDDLLNRK